jgi:hypothetical protein
MNSLWNQFRAWLASKNIKAKTIGGVLLAFVLAYPTSPWLQQQIATLFVGYPIVITKIGVITGDIAILFGMWAMLSHSASPAGTVAAAEVIQSKPNPPTRVEIEAAKPSTK